jgi:glycine reductase complex component B subunit alpha and beta
MRLDVETFEVRGIEFGRVSDLRDGLLSIRKEELIGLISGDNRLQGVDVEIVSPGEKTRITNVNDILEPRIKAGDSTSYYPGILSSLFRAGQGSTAILKGCAVMEIGYKQGFYGGVVDMMGEGASLNPYSRTHNVCILAKPAPDLDLAEYGRALKLAGAKGSVYLASAARGSDPDEVRSYDLKMDGKQPKDLPKVGYLFQLHSHGDSREPFIYGANSRQYYPTILHPNEILDGAIVCGHYDLPMCMKNTTYSILNHPVILDLYERHGKELDFRGVVVAPEPTTMEEIHRTAMMAAGLMKDQLGVDGVIITKEGGGHADVDLMRNCEACEDVGIKTVLMDNEWLGQDGTGRLSLLDMSGKADAIISLGNGDEIVESPPAEKVVGGDVVADIKGNLMGGMAIPVRSIPGAISQIGFSRLTVEVMGRGMATFTGMTPANYGVDLCRRAKQIFEIAGGAPGTDEAMFRMVRLLSKICRSDPAGKQSKERQIPGGIRKNVLSDKRGSRRAIELLLRKLGGKDFDTEIAFPGKRIVDPALTKRVRGVGR